MGRIKDTLKYIYDAVVSGTDYLIGSDSDENGKTKNYRISDIVAYAQETIAEEVEGIDQNNKNKVAYVTTTNSADKSVVVTRMNLVTTTFDEFETLIILAGERPTSLNDFSTNPTSPTPVYVYMLKDLGKGTYGSGGTALTEDDLIFISKQIIDENVILNSSSTQLIELGDIGSNTIEDGFNAQSPCVAVQDFTDGYVVVTATIDAVEYTYLFLGDAGTYGSSCLQAGSAEFVLLTDYIGTSISIENTSQLNNDGSDGTDQYVQFGDIVNGNAMIGVRGVRHITGMTYNVFGGRRRINNNIYTDFVQGNVIASDSHPTLNRQDLFVIRKDTKATGNVTLTGGGSGSVDSIEVNGVELLSSPVNFNSSLSRTALDVVTEINSNVTSPNYRAKNTGAVITIEAIEEGTIPNTYTVVSSATTITTSDVNMSGGLDNTASVGVITGVPNATPILPVIDFVTEVKVSSRVVVAGETSPAEVNTVLIYDENLGTPTEWDVVAGYPAGVTLNDATQSYNATATSISIAPQTSGNLTFENTGTPVTYNPEGAIILPVYLTGLFSPDATLFISIKSDNQQETIQLNPSNWHLYGLDSSQTDTWQEVIIPLWEFPFGDTSFDTIIIGMLSSPNVYIDYIQVQLGLGVIQPPSQTTYISLNDTSDDTLSGTDGMIPVSNGAELTLTSYGLSLVLEQEDYVESPDGNSYWDIEIADGGAGYMDIWFQDGSDRGNLYVDPTNTSVYGSDGTNTGNIRVFNGAIRLQQTVSGLTGELQIETPSVNGHVYKIPANTDPAQTNHLAISVNKQYADSEGNVTFTPDASGVTYDNAVSGLLATNVQDAIDEVYATVVSVDSLTDVLTEDNSFQVAGTSNVDVMTWSSAGSSAKLDFFFNNSGAEYFGFEWTNEGGGIDRLYPNFFGSGTNNFQLPSMTGGNHAIPLSVNNETATLIGGNITLNAEHIPYDNAGSGMTATDVQDAIDEISTVVGTNALKMYVQPTADTGSSIDLTYIKNICNHGSANNNITYTISDNETGGEAIILINAVSEPRITASSATPAGSFVIGREYQISTVGTTDFTLIGASANTVGVNFTATGVGSGTGEATLNYEKDAGSSFLVSTDMYMIVWDNGTDIRYLFMER